MTHPETLTLTQFARLAGFKGSYVTQLKNEGRLVLVDDGRKRVKVKVAESLKRIDDTKDPSKVGVAARHAADREAKAAPAAPNVPRGPDQEPEDDPEAPAVAPGNPKYQDARARRETALASQAERDLAISKGELLRRSEVRSAIASAVVTLRTRLESMGQLLAPQLVGLADQDKIAATVDSEVEHAFEELAHQFASVAKEGAAT